VEEAREGTVGAGTGASVGRMLGPAGRIKGGIGIATTGPDDHVAMGAIAVVNAAGDVLDRDGRIIAGARGAQGFAGSAALVRRMGSRPVPLPLTNTTLVAIATSAKLDKLALTSLAKQAHDGMAHAINPVHTAYDGDTIFTLSTGDAEADPMLLGVLAVALTAEAIRRAVRQATGVGGVPAAAEL
jgi:L-aminopeptidase/D-esterase-like protein